MADTKSPFTDKQTRELIQQLTIKTRENQEAVEKAKAQKNLEVAKRFLAENAKVKGVTTTKSGLQYMVLEAGEGASPKATSRVTVHYKGMLIDGTVFDSSYKRGQPATFPLNGVIKGWTEGIPLMKLGAKFRFFIPPELAYGERAPGETIPPNALLIFEVELIKILAAPKGFEIPK